MIALRPATLADIPLLQRWDRQPHVIAATGGRPRDGRNWQAEWFPPLRGWLALLIAEHANRPIGVVQIIDPAKDEEHYWGDIESNLRALDIWLGEPGDMGLGHGSHIMHLALEWCFADVSVKGVVLDPLAANTRAHAFYERLGFTRVGRRMFGSDDCLVYRLDRQNAKLRVS